MSLTELKCKAAKAKEKPYKLSDAGGLYLEVMPNASKYWRLKYRFLNKEKRLALGVYPSVSLSEARTKQLKAKKQLNEGLDPSQAKREEKFSNIQNAANTFELVAREWHELNKDSWSRAYPGKIMRILERHAFPEIGKMPISQISPPLLLTSLRKIPTADMASTVKRLCGQVFRYGIQTGKCERDPSADLKGALKPAKTTHYSSIDIKDLPALLKAIERNEARLYLRTLRALKLSLLTFCRPGEIRQAQWSEIDLKAKQWSIPAEKMKMRKAHIVPLSRQAVDILTEQQEETQHFKTDWVFPSQVKPQNAMSDGTVNKAIKRLGFGENMVAHGFRALARTAIREQLGYESEIIEKQLAHKTRNPLGEAYDRAQFLNERKRMMQEWSDYLDTLKRS